MLEATLTLSNKKSSLFNPTMLSRAASTARAARSLLQGARRSDNLQSRIGASTAAASCSSSSSSSSSLSPRRASAPSSSALPATAAPPLDLLDGAAPTAPPTLEQRDAIASLDEHFMRLALGQARKAALRGEVPVGALLVSRDGATVLAAEGNGVEGAGDATAHAELLCLQRAAAAAGREADSAGRGGHAVCSSPSLSATEATTTTTSSNSTLWPRSATAGSTLYVTLEPCAMCAGAALLARVGRIVYGARSAGAGADGSWVSLLPRGEEEEDDFSSSSSSSSSTSIPFSYPPLTPPLPARPHHSHPTLEVTRGVLAQECGGLLKEFFRRRRAEGARERGGGCGSERGCGV